jgi:uncharacterized membrane protein YeaQ/YmgE (transglycosylase-associated protein family)
MLVGGRVKSGWVASIAAGGVGALLGGWLGRSLALYRGERPVGFALSLLGALALAGAYQAYCLRHTLRDPRDALALSDSSHDIELP